MRMWLRDCTSVCWFASSRLLQSSVLSFFCQHKHINTKKLKSKHIFMRVRVPLVMADKLMGRIISIRCSFFRVDFIYIHFTVQHGASSNSMPFHCLKSQQDFSPLYIIQQMRIKTNICTVCWYDIECVQQRYTQLFTINNQNECVSDSRRS